MIRSGFFFLLVIFLWTCTSPDSKRSEAAGDPAFAIRLNQVGYYPAGPKKAVIVGTSGGSDFQVFDLNDNRRQVFQGKLSPARYWELAGDTVRVADFTALQAEGSYALFVEGGGLSFPFVIKPKVLEQPLAGAVRSYYYQRAGMALDTAYAGPWYRPAGHLDNEVIFHPSSGREGTTDSPGGWYDAGDYGKYVVNGAFSLGQMLFLQEQYPGVIPDGALNIPESGNKIPDLLDELQYEMDWLLTMQDDDGGVFFKLTTLGFGEMVLPHEMNNPRYIIGKSTAATLDFAAVAAKMARAFQPLDPSYAEKCLTAAERAWDWATAHPDVPFKNPEDVKTGEYGDSDFSGEFYWAAAELYVATQAEKYLSYLREATLGFQFQEGESWAGFAHFLGAFTLVENAAEASVVQPLQESLLQSADELLDHTVKNDYFQPVDEFHWGSNSDVMNAAMILAQAYRLDPQPAYLAAVLEITDYVFGKNATGYCFLTGFGSRSPMHIHHRPSAGDGLEAPVPGFLVGGPNSAKQDAHQVEYPENAPPMKCWVDVLPSFASNEVCINWNAPLVYVLGFLEAETAK